MTKPAAEAGDPPAVIESRRAHILQAIGRPADPNVVGGVPLAREHHMHLVHEAEELYWNELAWEEITDEERVAGGHLTELVFPGFLAFVDGLLEDMTLPGSFEIRTSHPEVVEELLLFLAGHYAEAQAQLDRGVDSAKVVWARALTSELIDLVLIRLLDLTSAERELLESGG